MRGWASCVLKLILGAETLLTCFSCLLISRLSCCFICNSVYKTIFLLVIVNKQMKSSSKPFFQNAMLHGSCRGRLSVHIVPTTFSTYCTYHFQYILYLPCQDVENRQPKWEVKWKCIFHDLLMVFDGVANDVIKDFESNRRVSESGFLGLSSTVASSVCSHVFVVKSFRRTGTSLLNCAST